MQTLGKCVLSLALTVAVACLAPSPASAAVAWTVTGPAAGAPVTATVSLDNGMLTFAVARNGTTVLAPSAIGIETSAADLTRNLTFLERRDQTITESYTMTTGKQRVRQTAYTQTTLSFSGTGAARLDVVVRVSSTGAAYRYVLPGSGTVTVRRETSSWSIPTSAPAWLAPPNIEDQGVWFETTAGGAPSNTYPAPALFDINGTFALLTETDVDGRYAASSLSHQAGSGVYSTVFASTITATLPLSTPWRAAAVGDLKTVTESTIADDLAQASKVADTSWVKPGTVAWSWLTEHSSPGDPARQRQYIDFAQRNGWGYVLIDEGWQASWAPDVVAYARARNVNVILWFNSSSLQTVQQRENWLPLVKSWGVAGVKIDFSFQFTQPTLKWYDAVLARTAELKLMANFHGSATPRGMQRTWPHVMTSEAVFGAEQQQNRAALNTILPFTRNVIASMDYTPVTFSITNRDTTDAHELATAIVFESGWQHDADNPASYEARPEALRILNQLPAAWDETRLLGGRPGREAYLARRNGGRWYVAGISALAAKTYQAPLSFLGAGQWLAETVRDGSGALLRETRIVANTDTLSVPMPTRGGFATVLCPYTSGMTTCGSGGAGGILKGRESGLCVDVPNNSQANSTAVQLWDCTGGANQSWTATPAGQLTVYGSKCLDARSSGTANGTVVQIYDCNGTAAQRWTVNADGTIVNTGSGKCLDAFNNGIVNGTALILFTCGTGLNQKWARNATTGVLRGQQSGRCVDVPNSNQANGTRPALWDCNGGGNQAWTSTAANQLSVFSTKCLQTASGATADGTAVQIWDCNGTTAQQWRVRASGAVVQVASGKCLDASGQGTGNGTLLVLWPCTGGANQIWARS